MPTLREGLAYAPSDSDEAARLVLCARQAGDYVTEIGILRPGGMQVTCTYPEAQLKDRCTVVAEVVAAAGMLAFDVRELLLPSGWPPLPAAVTA